MKKIIVLIIIDVLLVLTVFYIMNFSNNDIKVGYLPDVYNLILDDGISKLNEYEISVSYIESDLEKDKIVYTMPKANSIVYEKQMITIYVSKGDSEALIKNLENQLYEEASSYIEEIKNAYDLEIVITYLKDDKLLDGLIYKQIAEDKFLDRNDKIEFVVIDNKKTVTLPSFVGWHYQDVINYANRNDIRIEFEYVLFYYQNDYVIGQSVSAGTVVLKNSNPIIIYLAK